MFFQNNIIWSEFPEIWLYHNREIDKKDQQNLIQDDETTTNPDDIDGVQINNSAEFDAREEEDFEEESIISTNTETSNSDPFPTQNTRNGRANWKPQKYCDPNFQTNLTAITYHNYYQILEHDETQEKDPDIAAVGAAIRGGFDHTGELIPIKFKETMTWLDKDKWLKSVQWEYKHMVEDGVLKAVDTNQVKAEGKWPITSTGTMKKKLDGLTKQD